MNASPQPVFSAARIPWCGYGCRGQTRYLMRSGHETPHPDAITERLAVRCRELELGTGLPTVNEHL